MNYPEWAPPAVCELHKRVVARMSHPHDGAAQFRPSYFEEPIYRRLVSDDRMKHAWPELSKYRPQPDGTVRGIWATALHRSEDDWLRFVAMEVVKAAFDANRDFESRAAKRDRYESIAAAANNLAAQLDLTELGEDYIFGGAMHLLPDKTLAAILSRFDPKRFDGDYCDTWHFLSPDPLPENYTPDRYIHDSGGETVGYGLPLTRDLYGSFLDYMEDRRPTAPASPMYWPSVSEVLRSLAERASTIAARAAEEPRLVERDTKNRRANHAIRAIVKALHPRTGMVLRGTVATLVAVGLDWHEALSESDVEAALKGFDLSP
ncbi:MAG: hypothetical protein PHI64_14610 [Zoogloea sp.]|uniref:hypothetical protein n=1 Tax=Zoogloea sp. TaxID=49181 RepID=UPI00262268D6|nr:hypothetical protein [Zoogloea sp.]MDD2990185.1 hypothetical protein [Zoogloea sp.]